MEQMVVVLDLTGSVNTFLSVLYNSFLLMTFPTRLDCTEIFILDALEGNVSV